MGCTQSRIDLEDSVVRCKDRKKALHDAVDYRLLFAMAHSGYVDSLKDTGAALSDYGHGDLHDVTSQHPLALPAIPEIQPPVDRMPPPPPPPPPGPELLAIPLQRASSMPMMPIQKSKNLTSAGPSIEEEPEVDEEVAVDDPGVSTASVSSPSPPPPPVAVVDTVKPPPPPPAPVPAAEAYEYVFGANEAMPPGSLEEPRVDRKPDVVTRTDAAASKAPAAVVVEQVPAVPVKVPIVEKVAVEASGKKSSQSGGGSEAKKVGRGVPVGPKTLLQVLIELDGHFLEASQSALPVSKMLEATKMHYHSNFIDSRGHIDHSARVMQVITWNRSCKNINQARDGKDDYDNPELETLATILEKMRAWEKKLYEEVKECELMKIIYQRKVASLNKLQQRSSHSEALEKAKAAVSHLHTRYTVDIQTVESTVAEINNLRDNYLYFKLVYLVEGMTKMWETMHRHHDYQLKIINEVKSLNFGIPARETSPEHHVRTVQLWKVVSEWHSQFDKLVNYQKELINSLCSWLKLNLIPIDTGLKESSPQKEAEPAIKLLLFSWRDYLQHLPFDSTKSSIKSFAEVMHTIVLNQDDMSRQKEVCEIARRDYQRKKQSFEDWYRKYQEGKVALSKGTNNPESGGGSSQDDLVAEKKNVLETAEKNLKNAEDEYRKLCKQVRDKSLGCLRTHLPELFHNVSEFALKCSIMYSKLVSITKPRTV